MVLFVFDVSISVQARKQLFPQKIGFSDGSCVFAGCAVLSVGISIFYAAKISLLFFGFFFRIACNVPLLNTVNDNRYMKTVTFFCCDLAACYAACFIVL
ncbi:MAG: hypothetical protein WBJ48_10425 [Bacteroidales bacterium]